MGAEMFALTDFKHYTCHYSVSRKVESCECVAIDVDFVKKCVLMPRYTCNKPAPVVPGVHCCTLTWCLRSAKQLPLEAWYSVLMMPERISFRSMGHALSSGVRPTVQDLRAPGDSLVGHDGRSPCQRRGLQYRLSP